MELLYRAVGPLATNVYAIGDEASREAIAIDTATPCAAWLTELLATRGWTLKLIVSSHRHWDHIGDNAAVIEATGAALAAHVLDRPGIERPEPLYAPFAIPPSVPAVELAEGGSVRFGSITLEVLHTPGHTEGSVCLLAREEGLLFSGDTLFAGGWGRAPRAGRRAAGSVGPPAGAGRAQPGRLCSPSHLPLCPRCVPSAGGSFRCPGPPRPSWPAPP